MCLLQVTSFWFLLNATNLSCTNETVLDSTSILGNDTWQQGADTIGVILGDANFTLNVTIVFINKEHVTLNGSTWTTLECGSSDQNGISFKNTSTVTLQNLTLKECGFMMEEPAGLYTGIGIANASNIWITNVNLINSRGTGCSIVKSNGSINIISTKFEGTKPYSNTGKGGLYVSINASQSQEKSYNYTQVILANNTFKNNAVFYYSGGVYFSIMRPNTCIFVTNTVFENNQGTYGGGGLSLYSAKATQFPQPQLYLSLTGCIFKANNALNYGGGLEINIKNVFFNFSIESTQFINNSAAHGGGMAIHLTSYCHSNNDFVLYFISIHFHKNMAIYKGGGLHLHVLSPFDPTCNKTHQQTEFVFKHCTVTENKAVVGAAMIMLFMSLSTLPIYLPKCTFENCSFTNNSIVNTYNFTDNMHTNRKQTPTFDPLACNGSVIAQNFVVFLVHNNSFTSNKGTALCLESSILSAENGSTTMFSYNCGDYGGALAIFQLSYVELKYDVHFNFCHNSATQKGGALFIAESDYSCNSPCFLTTYDYSKAVLSFKGNNISSSNIGCRHMYGKSVYIYSIRTCNNLIDFTSSSKSIEFNFENGNYTCDMSTKLSLRKSNTIEPLLFTPVEIHTIGITIGGSGHTTIDSHQEIVLLGEPKQQGTLVLSINEPSCLSDENYTTFSIELQECPPGFIAENRSCYCDTHKNYVGITCDSHDFQARITREYFIGYFIHKNLSDSNVYYSLCPKGFCHMLDQNAATRLLPNESNFENLDYQICGPKRTGFVCAKCQKNYSCYFHTENFNCFQDKKCSLGFLFFFLSEILPVTFTLFIVVFFNIQLACGTIQGFILYAQVFESLHIKIKGENYLQYFKMIYHAFNLEFFRHDKLSFCLWKGATALNIIAMKYVTIVYSLLLIIALILIWNKCSGKIRRCSHKTSKISAVHGLSSFLILCYSQLTKISLLILTPATVYKKGGIFDRHVVIYDGEMNFLKGKHLAYAVPVIIFAVPLIVIPPFLLFLYPLCYKIFALMHLQESVFLKVVCRVIPLESFRPLFDSFQSSFKNEYRYFAGLYFIYRVLALLTFAVVHNLSAFYATLQFQFILMLLLHTWIQPYKKKWHNLFDSYILCTLAILNGTSLLNLYASMNQQGQDELLSTVIPVGLAYFPIVVVLGHYVYSKKSLIKKFWQKVSSHGRKQNAENQNEDEQIVLSLDASGDMVPLSTEYKRK